MSWCVIAVLERDVGQAAQGNPATLQTMFHQVHTPRQELGNHGQETHKFAHDQGCGRFVRRNSFSELEPSTRRYIPFLDQDMSVNLAAVLSKVNASDFPRLDFESEHSKAGAAESWLQWSQDECSVYRSRRFLGVH